MLSLQLEDFMIELKEGSIKNVGGPTKRATVKLYDVEESEAREFGDERVKLSFVDDDDNTVEVALAPSHARDLARRLDVLEEESSIFE